MNITTIVLATYSVLLPAIAFILPNSRLLHSVERLCNNNKNTSKVRVLSVLPYFRLWYLRKLLNGSAKYYFFKSVFNYICWIIILGIRLLLPDYIGYNTLATLMIMIVLAWSYLDGIIAKISLSVLVDSKHLFPVIFLLPPLASYLLANRVIYYYREHRNEIEGIFDGAY